MNAKKDQNGISTLLGALNTDGITPVPVQVTASLNALNINNGLTGSDNGTIDSQRDQNRIPILIGISATDGITPVEVYADSNGNLLVRGS